MIFFFVRNGPKYGLAFNAKKKQNALTRRTARHPFKQHCTGGNSRLSLSHRSVANSFLYGDATSRIGPRYGLLLVVAEHVGCCCCCLLAAAACLLLLLACSSARSSSSSRSTCTISTEYAAMPLTLAATTPCHGSTFAVSVELRLRALLA